MPVALITGASAGIGKEFARLYASRGYTLILVARRADALTALSSELSTQFGVVSHVVAADLSDPAVPEKLFAKVHELNLSVDVLVNNAGFGYLGRFAEVPADRLLSMINVNVSSLVHLSRLFLPEMISRGSGGILNVGSTAGFVPGPLMSVYYATKAFVLSFSEALWNELSGTGVKVSCLCPGATITEFHIHSGMDKTKLFQRGVAMDAASVARLGADGLDRNEPVVICGLTNKFGIFTARFIPRQVVASLVRRLQDVSPP
jgi:short-subunit dehydrogenase